MPPHIKFKQSIGRFDSLLTMYNIFYKNGNHEVIAGDGIVNALMIRHGYPLGVAEDIYLNRIAWISESIVTIH